MNMSCSVDGSSWSSDGRRQLQLLSQENVPRVTPAAMMAPAYQLSLNRPVMTDRSLGYASSAMSWEAPLMAYTIPMPRMMRATRNMATGRTLVSIDREDSQTSLEPAGTTTRPGPNFKITRTVDGSALQYSTNGDDYGSGHHTCLPTESIIYIWDQRDSNDSADGERGRHNSQKSTAGIVEICNNKRKSAKAHLYDDVGYGYDYVYAYHLQR